MSLPGYKVIRTTRRHLDAWIDMGGRLWPKESEQELRTEFERVLKAPREVSFLCLFENQPVGFVNVCLRVDYVEGSNSSPVGFLEGIYVEKAHRKAGIGKWLVAVAEDWAISKGATEMGSDAYASNIISRKFHLAVGYRTTKPIVHFIKKLAP